MKKIPRLQKLLSIIFTVVFLANSLSNAPAAYGRYDLLGEIMYWKADGGSFKGNGKEGSSRCGTCRKTIWVSCGKDCMKEICIEWWSGINRDNNTWKYYPNNGYTKDQACKAAYGSGAVAGMTLGSWGFKNLVIDLCIGGATSANNIDRVECLTSVPDPSPPPVLSAPCAQWKDNDPESGVCEKVSTSLPSGDMSSKPEEFITKILTIVLSFAGGIALLLIISAGYKIMTSKGKPEGIQQGKEQLVSAIVGLVFIIFSFVIFQLIMADILKIPGFTK